MQKETCKGCGEEKYIVNRTRFLCQECNNFRLHGETIQETQVKQQLRWQSNYQEKLNTRKKSSTTQAKKEGQVKAKLSTIKNQIRLEAIQDNEYFCQGCGKAGQLDCSHILSVKQRKDLELEKDNQNLLCRECHLAWESNDIERMLKLNCFIKDLNYIQLNDVQKYNQLLTKIIELSERIIKHLTLFFEERIKSKTFFVIKNYKYCES